MKGIGKIRQLEVMADRLRIGSIISTTAAGSGHPTSCMSCAEIMSALFFDELQEDDEFILSKGHAAPILWAAYAEAGLIPRKELLNLRKVTSSLEGHPTPLMPMVKVATGSLGQGLAAGVGMALGKRLLNDEGRVYVLLGDGECAEGSVWEAANAAAHYRLGSLCAVVDINRLGQSQQTMHGHDINAYRRKFEAFGWNAGIVNGHSVMDILDALRSARKSSRPFVILAKTFKGKGVSFLEDRDGWHGRPLDREQMDLALKEIGPAEVELPSRVRYKKTLHPPAGFTAGDYVIGDLVATRTAFGNALVNAGKKDCRVVAIDGDVKNSTMTIGFFREFPGRGFESFIAEQNMVGMAIGLSSQGFVSFVATFGAFLTRAHDFIRMAMYSKANIKFVGSHVGVSIGEDGPSQMGLEDIPMFISMPGSVVLYPCDAVSAERLTQEMMKHKGISYLRTTRGKTPVIYPNGEKFPLGKFKVLRRGRKDRALVIAAGETVHEALRAYGLLKRKKTGIRVIDLYSIKPLDGKELAKHAKECGGRVIVVEDHYLGGIGGAVAEAVGKIHHLYVKDIPRSGRPGQLRKKYCIDAGAIAAAVRRLK
ncbi:transketolase [Candidatus Woesearchaeota archaeon]|nr:transketolase [Candidatus Woesearchaeota archaeon]